MAELPPEVDVAIAGGGPVGCALALALSGSAVSVARIAGEVDFAALDGFVAVLVRPVEIQAGGVAERIPCAHDVAAELIDVAVVRPAQNGGVREFEGGADAR